LRNFDNWSIRLNFEITLVFANADFAEKVWRMPEQDFNDSHLVTAQELKARDFWFRFTVRCARLMAPVK
jgi:cardiolipin synthase